VFAPLSSQGQKRSHALTRLSGVPKKRRMAAWDVIVVGGGHAGCEAAAASAMGAAPSCSHKRESIGPCRATAIGGLGRGHLVREIDALDGLMGRAIDRAGIQFRVLNRSKGPAERGPRAQADRSLYRKAIVTLLVQMPGLSFVSSEVEDRIIDRAGRAAGVVSAVGGRWRAAAVIQPGTFLRGGSISDLSAGWPAGSAIRPDRPGPPGCRLCLAGETSTPPAGRALSTRRARPQPGDQPPEPFSSMTEAIANPQSTARSPRRPASRPHLAIASANVYRFLAVTACCVHRSNRSFCFAGRPRHQIFYRKGSLT
jgi:tRNA uridine 5-carboxymethylaminomethyl modification enzyme